MESVYSEVRMAADHYSSLEAEVRSPQSPSFSFFRDQGNTPKLKTFIMSRMTKDDNTTEYPPRSSVICKPMPPLEPLDYSARLDKQECLSPSAKLHPKKRPRLNDSCKNEPQTAIEDKFLPASPPDTPLSMLKFEDGDELKAKIFHPLISFADKDSEHVTVDSLSPSLPLSAFGYSNILSPPSSVCVDTPRSLSAFSRVSSRSSLEDGGVSEGVTLPKRKRSKSPDTRNLKPNSTEGLRTPKPNPETLALDLRMSAHVKPETAAYLQLHLQQRATLLYGNNSHNIINMANHSRTVTYPIAQSYGVAQNSGLARPSGRPEGVTYSPDHPRCAAPPSGQLRHATYPSSQHRSLPHPSSQTGGVTFPPGHPPVVVPSSGQRRNAVHPSGRHGGAANPPNHRTAGVGHPSGQPRSVIHPAGEPVSVATSWSQTRGSVQVLRQYQGRGHPSDPSQAGSDSHSQPQGHSESWEHLQVLGRHRRDSHQTDLYGVSCDFTSARTRDVDGEAVRAPLPHTGQVTPSNPIPGSPRVSSIEQVNNPPAGLLSSSGRDRSRLLHHKHHPYRSHPKPPPLIPAPGIQNRRMPSEISHACSKFPQDVANSSLISPSASFKNLDWHHRNPEDGEYQNKPISKWTYQDVVDFMFTAWEELKCENLDINFAELSGSTGLNLLRLDENGFRRFSKSYGDQIYRYFLDYKEKEERRQMQVESRLQYFANSHQYSSPFELNGDNCTRQSHLAPRESPVMCETSAPYEFHFETVDHRGLRFEDGSRNIPSSMNLPSPALKSFAPLSALSPPGVHAIVADNVSDPDHSNNEEEPRPEPPKKRGPGRPRKPENELKKKKKKTGRLWEFIRNLLLDPATCPSLVRWENAEEGMFRFVQAEKVAQKWGDRKQNKDMNYEKLSRAMRYYYKTQIFEAVLGRRLVYKFGKNAKNWRPTNPNFPDHQAQ